MQLFPALLESGQSTTSISASSKARTSSVLFDGVLDNEVQSATRDAALSMMGSTLGSNSNSSITETTSSILTERVTQEDFAALRTELRNSGLSEESLNELENKVNSEEGMTWKGLIEDVREAAGGEKKKSLSDEDKRNVLSLFDKLGFTPDEASRLLNKLENGQYNAVFSAVSDKIKSLPSDLSVTFDANEANAFGRALGLSGDSLNRLSNLFSQISGVETTPEGISNALLVIKGKLKDENTALDKVLTQLGDKIADAMEAAKVRQSNLANASSREDGVNHKLAAMTSENAANAQKNGEQGNASNGKDQGNTPFFKQNQGQQGSNTAADSSASSESKDSAEGSAASEFMSKIRLDRSVKSETNSQAMNVLGNGSSASNMASSLKSGIQNTSTNTLLQNRLLQQVETGLLKSLGQGVKQLSINLSPDEYGSMNIVLQSKNKEVQATIRAESPETAKMISENLHHLKQSLEQQGLKVAKIEVQTGLPQDTSTSWQGAQQHNQAREQREIMDRLRTTRKLFLNSSSSSEVVQNMQLKSEMAKVAQSGVDLFA